MNRLACDIVILGSGAAGGVLAATLAEFTGRRIVLLEKGGHFGRESYNQRELDMSILYADHGRRATADGAIPIRGGECVGGGTTVNLALCFDPVKSVWDRWRAEQELDGFSFDEQANDYGVARLNMARCLDDVRRRVHVHVPDDRQVNENNRLLETGCRRLGVTSQRFALNMKDCLECGFCPQGCAYDRKQGTLLTYIPDALQRGVQLIHHCRVDRILLENHGERPVARGVLAHVEPTQPSSRPNSIAPGALRIDAALIIVAAGAIESPALLQRSALPDPHDRIGRGLVIHPSMPVMGLMDHELTNYRGIMGTVYSDHYYRSHGFYLECMFGHPIYGATISPGIGPEHFQWMRNYRRTAGFGVMLIDQPAEGNRVQWSSDPGRTFIHYQLLDPDKSRLRFAMQRATEIMFAAGALQVKLPSEESLGPLPAPHFKSVEEAPWCRALRFLPHLTTVTSAHPQATVKMGTQPQRSVVNARGETHYSRQLIVCDGSVFPSSCGANPMISIMTLARYQGLRIAGELARYGL